MIYGYLRVSTDKQDVESQKIGVVAKAAELQMEIGEWITDDGVSGVKEYSKRKLGELMRKVTSGDVIIVSEISRLARSVFMLFRIVEFCMERDVVIYSAKDSVSTIKKNDLSGIMMVFCFGIAAQIEREMIVKRTVEGLERRRREGVIFGRPIGAASRKLLDGRRDDVLECFGAGLTTAQVARAMKVSRSTLHNFCKRCGIDLKDVQEVRKKAPNYRNSLRLLGEQADRKLEAEQEFIVSLMDEGMTNKYIREKLAERGCAVSEGSFRRWVTGSGIYEYYVRKNAELRAVRNAGCGKKDYHKY